MIPFVVPTSQARRHLGELLNQAFHCGRPFLIAKGKKPMAVLLGAREFCQIIELVEKHDPGLAETLAILADPKLLEAIEQGAEDVKVGQTVPIDDLLED